MGKKEQFSIKQEIFHMVQAFGGIGIQKETLIQSIMLSTGRSKSTIQQYLKEMAGQVKSKRGLLSVVDDSLLLTTTSRAPNLHDGSSDNSGTRHGHQRKRRIYFKHR